MDIKKIWIEHHLSGEALKRTQKLVLEKFDKSFVDKLKRIRSGILLHGEYEEAEVIQQMDGVIEEFKRLVRNDLVYNPESRNWPQFPCAQKDYIHYVGDGILWIIQILEDNHN